MEPFIKKLKITIVLIMVTGWSTASAQDFSSVKDIANRRIPWLAKSLVFTAIKADKEKDVFELSTKGNQVFIGANNVNAAAKGLGYYLNQYCNQSLSHMGNQIVRLKKIPEVNVKVRKESIVDYRYALNYCTINYSFSFYTWADWEKELDWMALNGVNLMLAPVGTELVWYNALIKLGYTDAEAKAFITGPAYTAWWLMGNLEGWGGPVSLELMKQQAGLQQKILARMKTLGIAPILQGFYGMVPHNLTSKIPNANVIDQGTWPGNEYKRPAIIIPTNSEFEKISDVYYSELKKLYGDEIKYFGGEPFHEGGKTAGVDVPAVAVSVQNQMQKHYPNSTWVLQGWHNNPSDKILVGLKKENTLVIELFGENTSNWEKRKGYNGTNFIWCNVSNFGEKTGLYGRLQRFIDEVDKIISSPYKNSLKGLGIIPEGINNNPVSYDLMLDLAWQDQKPQLDNWIENYTKYRYGAYNKDIVAAWKEFVQTVYNSPVDEKGQIIFQEGPSESIYCARPSVNVGPVSSWGTRKRNYDINRFKKAVALFVKADNQFKNSETYQTDKTDFLRQVMADKGDDVYAELVKSIQNKDHAAIRTTGNQFLTMLMQQDSLLNNNKYFALNRWLNQAVTFGKGLPDAKNVLYNAKAQLTFWGPDDKANTSLRDYAHKEWGGLLSSLYYERWKLFIDAALQEKSVSDSTFYNMEVKWSKQLELYPLKKLSAPKLQSIEKNLLN